MVSPEQSNASGPVPPHRYGLPICCRAKAMAPAACAARRQADGGHALRRVAADRRADQESAAGIPVRPAEHRLDIGVQVVVGEDRAGDVGEETVLEQVLGRPGDGVGRLVDARDPITVAVGRNAADVLAGPVHGSAAPGVGRRAADADLHRACRPERIGAAVHAGQRGPAVVALHLADPGQHDPRHPVARADRLEQGQVVGRDRVAGRRGNRRLRRRRRARGAGAAGRVHAARRQRTAARVPRRRRRARASAGRPGRRERA